MKSSELKKEFTKIIHKESSFCKRLFTISIITPVNHRNSIRSNVKVNNVSKT